MLYLLISRSRITLTEQKHRSYTGATAATKKRRLISTLYVVAD
jgi:hypothetical protein